MTLLTFDKRYRVSRSLPACARFTMQEFEVDMFAVKRWKCGVTCKAHKMVVILMLLESMNGLLEVLNAVPSLLHE